MTDRPYIELPDKDPGETLDYEVDLAEFILGTYVLDSQSVEIEDAGNGESPIELVVSGVEPVPGCVGGSRQTAVLFWLSGGTDGVRYKGKITASDNSSNVPDRVLIRRFYILVSE